MPKSSAKEWDHAAPLTGWARLACIIPPDLLAAVARDADAEQRQALLDTLLLDQSFRVARAENAARALAPSRAVTPRAGAGTPNRAIYDQNHSTGSGLGALVRAEGQGPVSDVSINQAYDNFGYTYKLYWDIFHRDSIDDQGLQIDGLVHFGTNYDNAFWDGAGHMFFGDGDGQLLTDTTKGIDVVGHELTHGVTQNEANLTYSGQSGALNESVSDVFGSLVKQYQLGQDAATADWLIGADIVGAAAGPGPALDEGARDREPVRQPAVDNGRLRAHGVRQRRCAHQLGHPEPRLLRHRDDHRRQRLGGPRADLVRHPRGSAPPAGIDVHPVRGTHPAVRAEPVRRDERRGGCRQGGLGRGQGEGPLSVSRSSRSRRSRRSSR